MVMKVFLEAHGWNCGFEGGITGYALILWLSAFLSMQSRNARSLAESLLGFFDYFGSGGKFDYYKTGLCISEPSCTFLKADNGMYYRETPYLLAIRDPPDHSNDVGRVAKSIPKIVLGFRTAFEKLTSLSIDDIRDQGHLFSILRIASANLSMRLPKVSFQTEPKEQGRKGQTLKSTGKLHQPKQYRNGQALKYSGSSQVQHQRKPKPHAKEHNLKRNGNSNRFKSSSDGKPSVQSLRTGDSRVTKKFKKLRT